MSQSGIIVTPLKQERHGNTGARKKGKVPDVLFLNYYSLWIDSSYFNKREYCFIYCTWLFQLKHLKKVIVILRNCRLFPFSLKQMKNSTGYFKSRMK